jgi:hypothetical protein
MEIFVFLRMGGRPSRIEILPIDEKPVDDGQLMTTGMEGAAAVQLEMMSTASATADSGTGTRSSRRHSSAALSVEQPVMRRDSCALVEGEDLCETYEALHPLSPSLFHPSIPYLLTCVSVCRAL